LPFELFVFIFAKAICTFLATSHSSYSLGFFVKYSMQLGHLGVAWLLKICSKTQMHKNAKHEISMSIVLIFHFSSNIFRVLKLIEYCTFKQI